MGHEWVSLVGAFVIWVLSGFKRRSVEEYFNHNFAFPAGVIFILLVVLIVISIL